jgi:effector-binding domain-containing protein
MIAERVELVPRTFVGLHDVVPMAELTDFFGRAYTITGAEIEKQGVEQAGPPIATYHGIPTNTIDITAGFPISQPITPANGTVVATLPGGPAIETIHTGTYDSMAGTYNELMAWMDEQHIKVPEDMWEEYLVGPDTEADPAKWQTRIVVPLS